MNQQEKFQALVSKEKTETLERARKRIKNRAMLRESQEIALKVLEKLDILGWTQRKLAKELNVSPQQVSKLVSGKENLTLETQVKLQDVLDIPILASYIEKRQEEPALVTSWSNEETIEICARDIAPMSIIAGGKFTRKISGIQKVNPEKRSFLQLQM